MRSFGLRRTDSVTLEGSPTRLGSGVPKVTWLNAQQGAGAGY